MKSKQPIGVTSSALLGIALILFFAFIVSGCAASPYFEVGVGYQVDENTDYLVRTTRSYQCSSPYTAHFETGLDFGRARVGYHHQSFYGCGEPFNSRPEIHRDEVIATYRFGGRK